MNASASAAAQRIQLGSHVGLGPLVHPDPARSADFALS